MLLVLYVPHHCLPTLHTMPRKPGICSHTPCDETHGIKPGSGDNLPQARSTNGCRPTTCQDKLPQLSRQGTPGTKQLQPTCPMSTSLIDGRSPGSGSQD